MNQDKAGSPPEANHHFPVPFFLYIVDSHKTRNQAFSNFLVSQGFKVKLSLQPAFASRISPDKRVFTIIIWNIEDFKNFSPQKARNWKKQFDHLSIILLAKPDSSQDGLKAIQEGWIDQVVSPDHWPALLAAIRSELQKESYRRDLAQKVEELRKINLDKDRTAHRAEELQGIYNATLENLMTALDLRDVETFGHSRVVARYSQALAQIIGIADTVRLDHIRQGAWLHDVGKIAIPDSILKKPGYLTSEEWEKIKLHPTLGYGLIKEINLAEIVNNIILYHHERYDGQGYPFGLKKEKIPLEARIFTLADALDAITSHRPYRQERDFKQARQEILAARCRQFDPLIVDAFCALRLEEWEKIRLETAKISLALENLKI